MTDSTTHKPIDRTALLESVGNDLELIRDLLGVFEDYYPAKLAKLKNAVAENDFGQLREVSHQLKSAVSSFHSTKAHQMAATLEDKGRAQELDDVVAITQAFEWELRAVIADLKNVIAEEK